MTGSEPRCDMGQFAEPKIEPEIIVHFRSAPPVSVDISRILSSIDWIAHGGFEIVQSHFPGWKIQIADTIADGGLHAKLFVGESVDVTRLGTDLLVHLESFTITLACDGTVREQGRGSNALGGPLKAIAHLVDVIARQPYAPPIQAGEMITTGTLTAALPIRPGQTRQTDLEGLGLSGLSISFEA